MKRGEPLSRIGGLYGVPWKDIAKANRIETPYTIHVGQVLIIPSPRGEQPTKPPTQCQGQLAKVIRVVDGDTIEVSIDGRPDTVRHTGIDTPETVHPSKPVEKGSPQTV